MLIITKKIKPIKEATPYRKHIRKSCQNNLSPKPCDGNMAKSVS
jgi:hypothetical protein